MQMVSSTCLFPAVIKLLVKQVNRNLDQVLIIFDHWTLLTCVLLKKQGKKVFQHKGTGHGAGTRGGAKVHLLMSTRANKKKEQRSLRGN